MGSYKTENRNGDIIWENTRGEIHRDYGPACEMVDGTKIWYKEGKLHRVGGSAVEYANGRKEWWIEGENYTEEEYKKKFRKTFEDKIYKKGPGEDGPKIWYKEGKKHREDGPAVEYTDGYKEWWIEGEIYSEEEYNERIGKELIEEDKYHENELGEKFYENSRGEFHREDGPAIEYRNGDKYWYKNGRKHRIEGPAVEYANGRKEWWIEGEEYTEEDFNNGNLTKEKFIINKKGNKIWKNSRGELHREDGPAIEYLDGTRVWYFKGLPHREDGPAYEYPNGDKYWYIGGKAYSEEEYNNTIKREEPSRISLFYDKIWENALGEYHRLDGPAIEYSNGDKCWYKEGKKHREDGPAFEGNNGMKEWWIEGERYSEEEYNKNINKKKNIIKKDKEYFDSEGYYHREDGPAIEFANGDRSWYKNGDLHRVGGPAIERVNGSNKWYINGKKYSEEEYNKIVDQEVIEGKCEINIFGDKIWEKHGKYHREDGPAIERYNGKKEWWIEGERYSEEEFNKINNKEEIREIIIDGIRYKLVRI